MNQKEENENYEQHRVVVSTTNQGRLFAPQQVVAPNGDVFRWPDLWDPYDKKYDQKFAEFARRNKNMSDGRVMERLIRSKKVDKEIMKDPVAVKELAQRYRNFYGHLDPHNMEDKIVLLNSKIMTDYLEWYTKHFAP